ncbi:MAG: hypothetical protein NZT92_21725 [Abditibacteriales bacterium]|nr:hypothetical protein [Abditibacteriales bacterium]
MKNKVPAPVVVVVIVAVLTVIGYWGWSRYNTATNISDVSQGARQLQEQAAKSNAPVVPPPSDMLMMGGKGRR